MQLQQQKGPLAVDEGVDVPVEGVDGHFYI